MDIAFPSNDYAGYIFDLDGTLIDSMPAHFRAWTAGLRGAGFKEDFTEDLFYSMGGVPTAKIVEMLNQRHGTTMDPLAVAHAKGFPVSIASGGMRHVVRKLLEVTGLSEMFPIIATPKNVADGKPSPDLFLLAAARMGVPARECLVFEDAEPGRQAAIAAGMDYVMVPSRTLQTKRAGA